MTNIQHLLDSQPEPRSLLLEIGKIAKEQNKGVYAVGGVVRDLFIGRKLKEIDIKLADPEKFRELSKNPDFFADYEQKQQKLKEIEQFWESANIELDTLKQ